jgi:glycosyltransferase involved in cell wall biosynthesis
VIERVLGAARLEPRRSATVRRVSVIVPVYNPGEHIDALLESLLSQSMAAGECELIFVDDGSSDGTAERLEALATAHEHVRFARVPHSGWPGRPRNVGIEMAGGEFLFFADHDDWLGPEALERLCATAVTDDADIVIGKVVGHGKHVPRNVFRQNRHDLTASDVPFSLLAPHKLFRRALLEEHRLRFPETPRRLEDHALVVPAFFHARRISILADYPCYHWIRRPDAANASLRDDDMTAFFDSVRDVLDIVDAHTPPGTLRDRLYLRWYRGKLLGRVGTPRFAKADPEIRQATFDAARRLARERFAGELDAQLTYAQRLRSSLLRRGSLQGLEALGRFTADLKAAVRVRDVRGDGTWLTLGLTGRLRAPAEPHPLSIVPDGAQLRLALPEPLRAHITHGELDVTDRLSDANAVVFLRSLADGTEWDLPTESSVRLLETDQGRLRPQVLLLARVAPTVAAAGAPLPAGDYELRAVVAIAGFSATARARYDGEPFRVTVTPARRLEHVRPPVRVDRAPTRSRRARRTLARGAGRIPGVLPALRRVRRALLPRRA